MLSRRRLLIAGAAAGSLLTGCDMALDEGMFNRCLAELPSDLREHPLVVAAWKGIDSAKVLDMHCHVFGNGDSGSGLWYNPRLEQIWRPKGYVQKAFYVNASCVDESPGNADASFINRLLAQCKAMAPGFQASDPRKITRPASDANIHPHCRRDIDSPIQVWAISPANTG